MEWVKDTSLLDSQKSITALRHPFSEQDQNPSHSPFPGKRREGIGDKRAIKEILTHTHRQKSSLFFQAEQHPQPGFRLCRYCNISEGIPDTLKLCSFLLFECIKILSFCDASSSLPSLGSPSSGC